MARKSNPDKDVTTPSAAAAQPRRTTASTRAKHTVSTPATPATPAREPETPTPPAFTTKRELSHEDIARLAYALWEARGCQGGNPEEDWRRAEEQLRQNPLAATA